MNHSVIPYGKQHITDRDIQAVVDVLKGDYLTQGPKVAEFEKEFAKYVGAKFAVAVANGTAALHLCTLSLGLKAGDQVITSPITFAASANCIRYCGAEVLFSDIDPNTYLLDIERVQKKLEADTERKIKGIIPVDFAGRPVNLEPFKELANKYDCWIIEDACHAPGARFNTKNNYISKSGSGQFADLAIFSFHPVKHIATGEGGMVTTNNKALYKQLIDLRTHGITREKDQFSNSIQFATGIDKQVINEYPGWYMEMQALGYNYRLSDIQAALGVSQLKRANEGIKRRREIASKYFEAFKDASFIKNQSKVIEGHAYHLYVIEVMDRLGLYNHLREKSIHAQIHYIPCHLMPYYRQFGWKEGDLPFAENYYQHCLSLPIYPSLTDEEQMMVIETIDKYYK